MTLPDLSVIELRVLGVLVEKQHTVPDAYPLTLNALVAGCNQKTSREPVLNATDAEVQLTLERLRGLSLVIESSGGRVMRYAHNTERVLGIPNQAVALLAVLMLRGPQTAAELRVNADRMHRFADVSAVDAFLHELATRAAGALVVELPRQSGTRETRWIHCLAGVPEPAAAHAANPIAPPAAETIAPADLDALRTDLDALRAEVAALREAVARLTAAADASAT